MTEQKSVVPISSSSQSSIAAMKNIVAEGRYSSLLPPTPSGEPTDHLYTLSLYL